jgi:hypothetical protein
LYNTIFLTVYRFVFFFFSVLFTQKLIHRRFFFVVCFRGYIGDKPVLIVEPWKGPVRVL